VTNCKPKSTKDWDKELAKQMQIEKLKELANMPRPDICSLRGICEGFAKTDTYMSPANLQKQLQAYNWIETLEAKNKLWEIKYNELLEISQMARDEIGLILEIINGA